jgi:hypothetical protein
VGVADDHDPEPVVEVDVFVAIDVPDPAALAALNEYRQRCCVLVGGGHAAGLNLTRLAPLLGGAPSAGTEGSLLALDQGLNTVSVKSYRGGLVCQISFPRLVTLAG